jgi:type VI secretion system protein ImpG
VGFDSEEGLFPYPATAWQGYRLLQEYFIFPEKFFFVDLRLPEAVQADPNMDRLALDLELDSPPDALPPFAPEHFALFASPAVNLFPYDTIPINADLKEASYPVRANATRSEVYMPYQINSVTAVDPNGREREFKPLLAVGRDPLSPSYTVNFPKNLAGQREMRISPVYPPEVIFPDATIFSLDVTYSNGDLPLRLTVGDVAMPLSVSSALTECVNLTRPTPPAPAPAEDNTLWAMLAHLHLNYLPLADAATLQSMLAVYLPGKLDAMMANVNHKRIEAIGSVDTESVDFLWKGRPVRGSDVTITLDEAGFSNVGDMCLFGMVAARFMHEYSAINSFMRVTVQDSLNRRLFQWAKHTDAPSLT